MDVIRIEPAPGKMVPEMPSAAIPDAREHGPMCRCTDCWNRNKGQPYPRLAIVPFANLARNPEPHATLSYGGVVVEIPLTLLHTLRVTDRQSTMWAPLEILQDALHEMEARMWSALGTGGHAGRALPPETRRTFTKAP